MVNVLSVMHPLEYFNKGKAAECQICGKQEVTKALCKNKHYVCNECHSCGVKAIIQICLNETSKSLMEIGNIDGPRCCKRNSFLSILTAIDYAADNFGIYMKKSNIQCNYSNKNNQCIENKCPFYT